MRSRKLIITLSTLAILMFGALVVYVFGTPQAAPPNQSTSVSVASAPSGAGVAEGEVPDPDPSSPLAIEIPGCTCHSDDPQLVDEHAQYRMNQCFGCHAGGMPEMAQ